MKPLRIVDLAEREFREATEWYRQRDPRVAERFIAEARRSLQLIEQFPAIGSKVPGVDDPHVRQMPIRTFPYNVVFDNLPEIRQVVAFAHKRKRPAYFIERLERTKLLS